MFNRIVKSTASAFAAVALVAASLVAGSAPAQAVGNANLFWVGFDSAWSEQIYSGSTSTTPITPVKMTGGNPITDTPNRGIASDGTYLYFGDATSSKLVRTNLDGTNRVIVASLSASVQGIAVAGGYVYWTQWNDGAFAIAANSVGGTPTQVLSGNMGGRPGSGYSGIAISGADIFLSVYDGSSSPYTAGVGLYHGTVSGLSIGSLTKNADYTGLATANPGYGIAADGTNLYLSSNASSRKGILKTTVANWNTALSGWTFFDTSTVTSYPGGIAVLGSDLFITDGQNGRVHTMTTSGTGLTAIYAGGTNHSSFQIAAVAPPSFTVTFDANGGTGTMAAQTANSATNLTANAFTKADHVFAYWSSASACSFAYNDSASYAFSANTTLYACWRGAGQISETLNGTGITTYGFGSVTVGTTNTKQLFLKNIGDANSLSGTISNSSITSGAGLSATGAANGATPACSFSGGTLNYGQSCAFTVTWTPSSAMTLSTGSHSFDIQFNGNFFATTFSGTAVTTKTVTFDANLGFGTMANQLSATTANLTANTLTRSGYNFVGWNTAANGTGTAYLDAAAYSFASNVTLYAQWALAAAGGIDSTQVRLGPIADKKVTPESKTVTLTGFNLDKVTQVLVNGVAAKATANGAGQLTIELPALEVGQSVSIEVVAPSVRIAMIAAFRVVALSAATGSTGGSTAGAAKSLSVYFAPGSALLTTKGKAALQAQLSGLKTAASIVVTGWAQDTGNNAGDRKLSAARSAAVVSWLKARGIKTVAAQAKGTLDKSAESRRVDLTYLTK
ncbi:MAG: Internalin-A precursor [Actinomycetota bacterium]|jgi:uncharacterized repeat protein (TIGR02543 family)